MVQYSNSARTAMVKANPNISTPPARPRAQGRCINAALVPMGKIK
jgi:hypothetical protein